MRPFAPSGPVRLSARDEEETDFWTLVRADLLGVLWRTLPWCLIAIGLCVVSSDKLLAAGIAAGLIAATLVGTALSLRCVYFSVRHQAQIVRARFRVLFSKKEKLAQPSIEQAVTELRDAVEAIHVGQRKLQSQFDELLAIHGQGEPPVRQRLRTRFWQAGQRNKSNGRS